MWKINTIEVSINKYLCGKLKHNTVRLGHELYELVCIGTILNTRTKLLFKVWKMLNKLKLEFVI